MNRHHSHEPDNDDDGDGDLGLVIKGNTGPVHLGNGDINTNTVVLSGDGLTFVAGDNPAGISKSFGGKKNKKKRK
ncbi:hypothetical protein GCM10022224_080100 [Nonomuraea antimicrobica]|uniref:Uncharacterized protein n=1 Tax=Nonomuraea antimicrobica TaxID=561173 RepID=A0ABP7DDV0_9ACTN